jgi:F0F1-type ATP synthase assembly protein I
MATVGNTIKKKATRATLRHSVHGFASKAQRKPLRSATLLSIGVLIGAALGWLAARRTG